MNALNLLEEVKQHRKPEYPINPLIINRWSPRAMTGEEIPDKELFSLFEAARWAPSAYNEQPWRFIYAKRNTKHWDKMFNLLGEFNQSWAKNAPVLILIISKKISSNNGKPNPYHQFDTGSAWENMAVEAVNKGLVTHAMAGFNHKKARTELKIPDDYDPLAMVAVGKKAQKEMLPQQLQEREIPSQRKPLKEIVIEGEFK